MTDTRVETLSELHFTSWVAQDFGCPLWLADRVWHLVCQRLTSTQVHLLSHSLGWHQGEADHNLRRTITPRTLVLACEEAFPTSLIAPRPAVVREVECAILARMRHADQWQEAPGGNAVSA